MNISIIIVTFNNSVTILTCLKSIFSQFKTDVPEIIVIDNASTDNTVEIIKNYFPVIKLIENAYNVGFAAAVNYAVKYTSGKFILLLNPDTILHQGFFEMLHSAFEKINQPFIMGCKLLNKEGEVQRSVYRIPTITNIIFESFLPYQYSIKLITKKQKSFCEVDAISGACMVIDRKIYEALGGFDEKFFMYYEDVDFCLRARKADYAVYFNPELEVTHYLAKSSWQDLQIFFMNIYTSKIHFLRKHYRKSYFFLTYPLIIMGIILRVVTYFIVGILFLRKHLLRLAKYHIFVLRKNAGYKNN